MDMVEERVLDSERGEYSTVFRGSVGQCRRENAGVCIGESAGRCRRERAGQCIGESAGK